MLKVFREVREAVVARRARKGAPLPGPVPPSVVPHPPPWMHDESSPTSVGGPVYPVRLPQPGGQIPVPGGLYPQPYPPQGQAPAVPQTQSRPQSLSESAGTGPPGSAAPPSQATSPAPASRTPVWSGPVEPSGVRRFRRAATAGVVVLSVAGLFSIVQTTARVVAAGSAPPVESGQVPEVVLTGVAAQAAVDYLSFDEADRPRRTAALGRYVPAGASAFDGWDGSGRQSADAPVVVSVVREAPVSAVVSVRVRATPQTKAAPAAPEVAPQPAPSPSAAPPPGPAVAAGPVPVAPKEGWSVLPPRWLTVAVPVRAEGPVAWLAGTPALVGSPVQTAMPPAVPGGAGDTAVTGETRATAESLIAAYAASDLDYERAAGASFTGLDRAASVKQVSGWKAAPAADAATRSGDLTVTWQLEGGAGLSAHYRLDLTVQHGKTYLAGVAPLARDGGA